jgi:hypothetical protein
MGSFSQGPVCFAISMTGSQYSATGEGFAVRLVL